MSESRESIEFFIPPDPPTFEVGDTFPVHDENGYVCTMRADRWVEDDDGRRLVFESLGYVEADDKPTPEADPNVPDVVMNVVWTEAP